MDKTVSFFFVFCFCFLLVQNKVDLSTCALGRSKVGLLFLLHQVALKVKWKIKVKLPLQTFFFPQHIFFSCRFY